MIELTAQDGALVTVNPSAIWHIRSASGDQSAIYSASGAVLFVQESYEAVCDRLRGPDGRPTDHAREDD